MFTADASQLEDHIRFFRTHYRVVNPDEALEIASGRVRSRGQAILLTFDDGYLDNYQVAFPVLKTLGVQAVFFLVSDFVGAGMAAWWDKIAWLLRKSGRSPESLDSAIAAALEKYKSASAEDAANLLRALEIGADPEAALPSERLFLTAGEARSMKAAGMLIGSHSRSHRILSKLSPDEQGSELLTSRASLEQEVGPPIDVFAYPVGGPQDFTTVTQAALRDCGYRAAFSCHGGSDALEGANMYDIKRVPVYWGARPQWLVHR